MEMIINSLYSEGKINSDPNCSCCRILEKKLLKSEYKNMNLMYENKKLMHILNNKPGQMANWSAIEPNVETAL